MTTLPTPWRKPAPIKDGHGPELRLCGDAHVEIRHSRDHAGPDGQEWFAAFSRAEFAALVTAIRAGEFDDLAGIETPAPVALDDTAPFWRDRAIADACDAIYRLYAKRGWSRPALWWVREAATAMTEAAAPAIRAEAEQSRTVPGDLDRDFWGAVVRALWVAWAIEQDNPKPSWLVPWDGLGEADREADRRIGTGVAAVALGHAAASARSDRIGGALAERERCAGVLRAKAAEFRDSHPELAVTYADAADLIEDGS